MSPDWLAVFVAENPFACWLVVFLLLVLEAFAAKLLLDLRR